MPKGITSKSRQSRNRGRKADQKNPPILIDRVSSGSLPVLPQLKKGWSIAIFDPDLYSVRPLSAGRPTPKDTREKQREGAKRMWRRLRREGKKKKAA